MPIEKLDLYRCLTAKFGFEDVPGAKHDAVALWVEGTKVATTRFSRSHHEIGSALLGRMAAQIWVQLGYLKGMYSCRNSREDYLELLRQTDHLR